MVASGGTPGATTFWLGDHAVAEVGVGITSPKLFRGVVLAFLATK